MVEEEYVIMVLLVDLAAVVVVGVQLAHQELLVKEMLAVMELHLMAQIAALVVAVALVQQVIMHHLQMLVVMVEMVYCHL